MNSLSWTIYLAEAIDSLNTFLAATFWAGMVGGTILYLVGISAGDEPSYESSAHKERRRSAKDKYRNVGRKAFIVAVIATPFAIITPSAQTIYLIAASQAGEMVIKDPEMQGIFNDLKAIIKQKIKDQLPKQS